MLQSENGSFKKITILVLSPHGDVLQDLEWPETHPVGGSETAALHLAASLKKRGYLVRIITNPDDLTGHRCDVFISLRQWKPFAEGIRPGRLNYLWCQDDADQPLVAPLRDSEIARATYAACTGVILLSHYHAQRWLEMLHVPVDKIFLTTNGIPKAKFTAGPDDLSGRRPWAYYASTPFRGLNLLLKGWPLIKNAVPDAQLHIFSSMKVYQVGENDSFLELYELARSLPGIHYHGSVGQAQLRQTAQQCRVLAYPNTFPETSCIAAMEAMAAGCVVAGTALGALPETAWKNPMVPAGEDWFERWLLEVTRLLTDDSYYAGIARQNLVASQFYNWDVVAERWLNQFQFDLLLQVDA